MTVQPRCVHERREAPVEWIKDEDRMCQCLNAPVVCVCVCVSSTSDNGQLCRDGHLSHTVACHTLVDVLVSRSSEWLYPQHSAGSIIELDSLDSQRTTQ